MKKVLLTTAGKLGCIGIISFVVVLILRYGLNCKYSEISKTIRLEPGAKIWDVWTDMPIPIYSKFFFFNVTNSQDVVNGQKPIVREVGPYVYQEHRMKVILNVNEETVKYRPRTNFVFRPELSFGNEDDPITLLNVPFVGISKMAWDMSKQPYVLSTLDDMLVEKGEKVFQTNKVKELLFDGVPIENYMELLSLPVADMFGHKGKIPERLLDGDFGFMEDRNGTAEDIWTVKTGKKNLEDFGRVVSWNGQTKLEIWDSDKCNEIRGTDGSVFPPYSKEGMVLDVFTPELCRSLQMNFHKNSDHQGLSTMLFTFAPNTFGSLKDFPEKECFCKDTYEHCLKGGLMPLGKCHGGAPLFLSHPHFMNAHPDYVKEVDGIHADSGDYQSYIIIEKNLGIVIGATFRLQINVELQPYDSMTAFTNVPNVMFPLMWIEQSAIATEDLLEPIRTFAAFLQVMEISTGFLMLTSCAFCFASIYLHGKSYNWNIRRMIGRTN